MDDVPTRGAALALADEKRFLEAGHEFLDEKRMLLAAALLKEMDRWRELRDAYDAQLATATLALKAAIARHGLDSLALYPAATARLTGLDLAGRNYLGLSLLEMPDPSWAAHAPPTALDASAAAEDCRRAFADLVPLAIRTAISAENIRRLILEYRLTERRARALENVVLPETTARLSWITEYLEDFEQEEALRNRRT